MEQQKNATTVQPLHSLRAEENVTPKTLARRLAGAQHGHVTVAFAMRRQRRVSDIYS